MPIQLGFARGGRPESTRQWTWEARWRRCTWRRPAATPTASRGFISTGTSRTGSRATTTGWHLEPVDVEEWEGGCRRPTVTTPPGERSGGRACPGHQASSTRVADRGRPYRMWRACASQGGRGAVLRHDHPGQGQPPWARTEMTSALLCRRWKQMRVATRHCHSRCAMMHVWTRMRWDGSATTS